MRSLGQELLPNALLNLPEVGRLAGEGSAVDFAKSGEPLTMMLPEVPKDRLVGVEPQKLTDDLDGKDLSVRELGSWAALTNTASLEPVVDEAEGGNDEGAKNHERRPPLRWSVWLLPSVGGSSL